MSKRVVEFLGSAARRLAHVVGEIGRQTISPKDAEDHGAGFACVAEAFDDHAAAAADVGENMQGFDDDEIAGASGLGAGVVDVDDGDGTVAVGPDDPAIADAFERSDPARNGGSDDANDAGAIIAGAPAVEHARRDRVAVVGVSEVAGWDEHAGATGDVDEAEAATVDVDHADKIGGGCLWNHDSAASAECESAFVDEAIDEAFEVVVAVVVDLERSGERAAFERIAGVGGDEVKQRAFELLSHDERQ